MRTLNDLWQYGVKALREAAVTEPQTEWEWLIEHVTGFPRLEIPLHRTRTLERNQEERLLALLDRRCRREPLQRLIGWVSFRGLRIDVAPGVFIPRPETELLAERALASLGTADRPVAALDLGTGTGCLAIALAQERNDLDCWMVDRSPEALALAQKNADRHRLADRLHPVESDWFVGLPPNRAFDLVVANPPYIAHRELETLPPEVRVHDPRLALDGGETGLDAYREIAEHGRTRLAAGGSLMLEIGAGQGMSVQQIFVARGWKYAGSYRDYGGHERILAFAAGDQEKLSPENLRN